MRGLPRMASICGDLSGCPVLPIELSCFLCGCTSKRPLSVVKRTFGSAAAMSANDPKRTFGSVLAVAINAFRRSLRALLRAP